MMDVFFNELSVPLMKDLGNLDILVEKYAQVIKEVKSQGFNMVRYEKGVESIMLSEEYSLSQYLYDHRALPSASILLTTQARPYIPDGDVAEDAYILNEYFVEMNGKQVKSEGFTAAAINRSIAIGFDSPEWLSNAYSVIESNGTSVREIKVLYAYDTEFFALDIFQSWADTFLPPTLISSELLPSEKKIHLSRHHGYDELMKFAKRICRESYVNAILNSIDRDSNVKQFARCITGTNVIEITLVRNGYYGMAVSTTARNDRELRCIANLITEKYT